MSMQRYAAAILFSVTIVLAVVLLTPSQFVFAQEAGSGSNGSLTALVGSGGIYFHVVFVKGSGTARQPTFGS